MRIAATKAWVWVERVWSRWLGATFGVTLVVGLIVLFSCVAFKPWIDRDHKIAQDRANRLARAEDEVRKARLELAASARMLRIQIDGADEMLSGLKERGHRDIDKTLWYAKGDLRDARDEVDALGKIEIPGVPEGWDGRCEDDSPAVD